jgi:hypothetical protein
VTSLTAFDIVIGVQNTEYKNGFSATHPTIVMFWDVFHKDLSLEDKKNFLCKYSFFSVVI